MSEEDDLSKSQNFKEKSLAERVQKDRNSINVDAIIDEPRRKRIRIDEAYEMRVE